MNFKRYGPWLFLGAAPVGVWAQTAPATPADGPGIALVTVKSDKTNYLSDRIKFSFATAVSAVDMTVAGDAKATSPACAPAFTTFSGIGTVKVGSDTHPLFRVTSVPEAGAARCKAGKLVTAEDVVFISQNAIDSTPPDRYGFTYGGLIVPYKLQLSGDRGLSGKASVGGYVGFRQDRSGLTGLALQYVVFLGGASIAVPQTVDGKLVTQDISGLSYGVALLGTVKGEFRIGLVLGADRVNKSVNYANNGKPWLALSVGYDFTN